MDLKDRVFLWKNLIKDGYSKTEALNQIKETVTKKYLTTWGPKHIGNRQNAFARIVKALSVNENDRNKVRGMARLIVRSQPKLTVSHDSNPPQ